MWQPKHVPNFTASEVHHKIQVIVTILSQSLVKKKKKIEFQIENSIISSQQLMSTIF